MIKTMASFTTTYDTMTENLTEQAAQSQLQQLSARLRRFSLRRESASGGSVPAAPSSDVNDHTIKNNCVADGNGNERGTKRPQRTRSQKDLEAKIREHEEQLNALKALQNHKYGGIHNSEDEKEDHIRRKTKEEVAVIHHQQQQIKTRQSDNHTLTCLQNLPALARALMIAQRMKFNEEEDQVDSHAWYYGIGDGNAYSISTFFKFCFDIS